MSDVSESVRIQQAMQRLIRWVDADDDREFCVMGGCGEAYICHLTADRRETFGSAETVHDAIDAALNKVGAPQ